jgi:hypothetical protein
VSGIQRKVIEVDTQSNDCRLMTHRVDAAQRRVHDARIANIAAQKLRTCINDRFYLMSGRVDGIEHKDLMALIEKLRNHDAADEAGTTGDEYAHGLIQPQSQAFRVGAA